MRGTGLAILAGVALIALLTPLAQFATMAMLNSDMETASPSGWAVGLLFSLVLAAGAIRLLARWRVFPTRSLVLLYAMLSIAVPLMNIGLARPLVLSLRAVQQHFVNLAQNTYRTAYQAQSPAWFPVTPSDEGLAWNKAERLLVLLRDDRAAAARDEARRRILQALLADAPAPEVAGYLSLLGVDELEFVQEAMRQDSRMIAAAQTAGWGAALEVALGTARARSAAAAARLAALIARTDEQEAGYLPVVQETMNRDTRLRLEEDRRRLSEGEQADLARRIALAAPAYAGLQREVMDLSAADWARVRAVRAAAYREAWAGLPETRLAAIRTSFIYRSSGPERAALYAQDGRNGTPNQNLAAFQSGFLRGSSRPNLASLPVGGQLAVVCEELPWGLWVRPLCGWGALVLLMFLFLMCLAEVLRRKWVDRENLAFPMVEVADHLIRHGFALETAEDLRSPASRGRSWHRLFWVGAATGALILAVEALGHYRLIPQIHLMAFDVSARVFTSGPLKEISGVVFVLSPILVGLLFLVSLEVSFSIWVIFLLYSLAFFFGRQAFGEIKDSIFTGWAGGRFYPFPMEQLLGAALCCAVIVLVKARIRSGGKSVPAAVDAYVPKRLFRAGLVLLPLAILGLLWRMGVTNLPFVMLVGGLVLLMAIAAARLRAETGLPTQHVTYEFTKFPMVFGLTGWTGARVFTLFVSLAVLPVTLLFRTLGLQLENLELARRNGVSYRAVGAATLASFLTAVPVGLASFLILAYWQGDGAFNGIQTPNFEGIVSYPLWISHFLGEQGLDQMRQPHLIRVWYVALGAGVFGLLSLLRGRVMNFPLHPIGYLLVLSSVYFEWVSPYYKGAEGLGLRDTSWLWGSALTAWLIKKLIVKYGGMNRYRQAKPFFIGLVAGAVLGLFTIQVIDLAASMAAIRPGVTPGPFMKTFTEVPAYTPRVY